MESKETALMDICRSIQQILSREEIVTDLFYDIFLDRHPEVRNYFVDVNLNQQAAVLKMTLLLIEHHYREPTAGLREYLKILGERHPLREIPVSLYAPFCDCLLETLRRFHDGDWDVALEKQWRAAIESASQAMWKGYAQPTTK